MMAELFADAPLLALFVTLAVGHLVGKLRVGTFKIGGVAGTLLVAVAIGQFGVSLGDDLKTITFALFIYAVGYQGGPQFVRSFNRGSLSQLVSASTMAVVGLLVVLACAFVFDLDKGTAAGLGGGGLTQSAIVGVADEAIAELPDVTSTQVDTMQANLAVAFALTYIFGQIGPIFAVTWLVPRVMRWNVREEARQKAERMSSGAAVLAPGEVDAVEHLQTRLYVVDASSELRGHTIAAIDDRLSTAAVEAVVHDGAVRAAESETVIDVGDTVALTGRVDTLEAATPMFGREVPAPDGLHIVEERRDVVITNPDIAGRTVGDLRETVGREHSRGVFLRRLTRSGREAALLADAELHRGDELQLVGRPADVDRMQARIGYAVPAARITDFVFFGLGMALGLAIGQLAITFGEVTLTLGTGGGCLVAGLLFGWLRSTHPRYAALPSEASDFLREFGLAAFVGIIGLTAGQQAIDTLRDNGVELFAMGVAVTMLPMLIVFPISYYVLRIRDPIDALACLVGGRHSSASMAALLEQAGNATPVASFTITYALSNVLLTVWGSLIVGLVPATS